MLLEVKIGALIMDPNTNTPIVVLKGVEKDVILPIWVGAFEANAIALEIEKVVSPRPLTHDLFRNFIIQVGHRISRVIITDLRENTFYALIELSGNKDEEIISMDARPSDAIALALRLDCPIFIDENLIDVSASSGNSETAFDDPLIETSEEWPDLIG